MPFIDITLSTLHSTGGKHPQMVNDHLRIYTENPSLGASWFREMMQTTEDRPHDVNVCESTRPPKKEREREREKGGWGGVNGDEV